MASADPPSGSLDSAGPDPDAGPPRYCPFCGNDLGLAPSPVAECAVCGKRWRPHELADRPPRRRFGAVRAVAVTVLGLVTMGLFYGATRNPDHATALVLASLVFLVATCATAMWDVTGEPGTP